MDSVLFSEEEDSSQSRLQKAIERNRLKQQRRASKNSSSNPPSSPFSLNKEEVIETVIPNARTSGIRRSVGKVDETEFTEEFKRPSKRTSEIVTYSPTTTATTKRKPRKKKGKAKKFLVKASWIFCGFLVLRLIFSERGVIDYYQRLSLIKDIEYQIKLTQNENIDIGNEIDLLKTSNKAQRKAVREQLGLIAKDEYLVLFANEKMKRL